MNRLVNDVSLAKDVIPGSLRFMPTCGLQTVVSKPTLQTRNGQSSLILAVSRMKFRLECERTTPRRAGMYLQELLTVSSVCDKYRRAS